MANSGKQVSSSVVWLTSLAIIACLAAVLWLKGPSSEPALEALKAECAQLREQADAHDKVISDLRAAITRLENLPTVPLGATREGQSPFPPRIEAELSQCLAALTRLQSNTLSLIARQSGVRLEETPEQSHQRQQEVVVGLRSSLEETQQKLLAAKEKFKEVFVSLNVPDEIAVLNPQTALSSLKNQAYWPYFEAKKEWDFQQLMVERIRMQLVAQEIDLKVPKR